MDEFAPLMPHVLRLIDHDRVRSKYLALSPVARVAESEACVFPSFALALRYAAYFIEHTGTLWMPVAAPLRKPSVGQGARACRACGCTDLFACPNHCAWVGADLCSNCARPAPPEVWAVYDSPKDMPGKAVARKFIGIVPTNELLVADTYLDLQAVRPPCTVVMPRAPGDDPVIVETWLA